MATLDSIEKAIAAAEGTQHPVATTSETILPSSPSSPPMTRQNTAPMPTHGTHPRTRNPRNLTLPSPTSPNTSSPSTSTVQPNQYQSFAEGAANLAGQGPLLGGSSSRPQTPYGRPMTPGTPALVPRTPVAGRPPLGTTSPLPATSPTSKPSTKGKLKSLLPRSHSESHSYFHAKVEIEQLASVPFVRGEFGVRWKFKSNVGIGEIRERYSPPAEEGSGGLLGKMKARSHGKGKAREDPRGVAEFGMHHQQANTSNSNLVSEGSHTTTMNSYSSYSSGDSVPTRSTSMSTSTSTSGTSMTAGSETTTKAKAAPNGNLSRNFFSPPAGDTSPSGMGVNQYLFSSSKAYEDSVLFSPNHQPFSSNAANPVSPGTEGAMSPSVISPTGTITQANASSHPLGFGPLSPRSDQSLTPLSASLSPSKGLTPYLPLKDHSITFSYPLNAILKFDLSKGSASHGGKPKPNLQPNEFKLVVMQRVIPDDPDGPPQNPRLGAVHLNLAEYVGKGRVERRYLLKDSRVNATLKLSVELTYVSGSTDYVAPPLPKAEIMGGIENFLVQNETLYKQRAKDLYGYTFGAAAFGISEGNNLGDEVIDEEVINEGETALPEAVQSDPYAPPSESESEFDDQGPTSNSEVDRARRTFLRTLSRSATMPAGKSQAQPFLDDKQAEKLPRRQLKREERHRKFRLELESNPYALPPSSGESGSESETDGDTESEADAFESAPEEEESSMHESQSSIGHSSHGHHRHNHRLHGAEVSLATIDIRKLPLAYGPKTTEVLIDALFNPVLTTDPTKVNPFTMYVSQKDLQRMNEQEQQMLYEQYSGRHGISGVLGGMPKAPPLQTNGRSFSQTTTSSTTTTSDSGGSPSDGAFRKRLRSPGQDTIVGVPARSQAQVGLGLNLQDRERDATIGRATEKSGGVGALLHSYYRNRKEKIKESRKKAKPRRSDTTSTIGSSATSASEGSQPWRQPSPPSMNVLGSPVFVQEPGVMYNDDGGDLSRHHREGTGGTMDSIRTNNSSSTSLSSLSLSSRSGHGHGHVVPPVPPLIPGNVSAAAAASAAKIPSPVPRPLMRQNTTASNDLSVPDGRMDKMGFVKGSHAGPGTSPVPAGGFGSSINRWWKGLGGHGHASSSGSTHRASSIPAAVPLGSSA